MASTAQIYGQIGAAKAFASSVSNALDDDFKEQEINDLETQLSNTQDEEEQKRLKKQIKRKKRINKLQSKAQKASQKTADFLAKIAAYVDIGVKELINWISYIIVGVLPALEVAVKMLLLTNIKKMVSCVINPRIPDYMRYEGILLNELLVDPRQILQNSPFSKWGKYSYFGCFEDKEYVYPKSPYSLSRAEDMNAFLWFTKNCAHFVSPTVIRDADGSRISDYFDVDESATLFNTQEFKGKDEHQFLEGCTFKHEYNGAIFLCVKKEHRPSQTPGNDTETWYRIIQVSDSWITDGTTSAVWYKDRTSLTGLERNKINYNKSKPLFHIEYIGDSPSSPYKLGGNFKFKILPKPFAVPIGFGVNLLSPVNKMSDFIGSDEIKEYVGSDINTIVGDVNYMFNGIQSLKQSYARFNSDGFFDRKGKFSIDLYKYNLIEYINTEETLVFAITYNGSQDQLGELIFYKDTKEFEIFSETLPKAAFITECYFGKTVFEFNYDYVVSMKLFDQKSIASSIVNALLNINIPIPFKRRTKSSDDSDVEVDTTQLMIDSYVDKMVEKLIDTETGEYTDCFYTFSNEEYESLEQELANKISNNTLITKYDDSPIEDVYNVLNSYDADSTLNERTETITKTLIKAADICGFPTNETPNSENNPSNRLDGGFGDQSKNDAASLLDFIKRGLKSLISAVVNALLSPKVLMLIQINRILMGGQPIPTTKKELINNYTIDIASVLDGLKAILTDIIRQVIDMILKEFLKLILERIKDLILGYIKKLGIEIAMKWVNIVRMLVSCFKFNRNRLNIQNTDNQNGDIQSIINQVDYADIDTLIDEIIPQTNKC